MAIAAGSPGTTLAVIIGASRFPLATSIGSNEAFRRSAAGVEGYLLSRRGFGLPVANLLWLFDLDDPADTLDHTLTEWLKAKVPGSEGGAGPARDLILYYVGHGCFAANGSDYALAIRRTREEKPYHSSYQLPSLAHTLKTFAGGLRKYVILDCCFSASAYKEFMATGPLEVVRQRTEAVLPRGEKSVRRGTALLCASGPRVPAKAPGDLQFTMFSGALLEVLSEGRSDQEGDLTLAALGSTARDLIFEMYNDDAVRPEVLSPEQLRGDVAEFPIFPNRAIRSPSPPPLAPPPPPPAWSHDQTIRDWQVRARKKLLAGAAKLAWAVGVTLGPNGREVILDSGSGTPSQTDDTISITDALGAQDKFAKIGAEMVRKVVTEAIAVAGDGGKTAAILALSIYQDSLRSIIAGSNVTAIRHGIDKTVDVVSEHLHEISTRLTSTEEIKRFVAGRVDNDSIIGELLTEALEKVGVKGEIIVQQGSTVKPTLELVQGIQFDSGDWSPYFSNTSGGTACQLDQPYIIICDQKINKFPEMVPILEMAAASKQPLLIIAEEIASDVVAALVVNKLKDPETFRWCAITVRGAGNRRAVLQDIAALTGGPVFGEGLGVALKSLKLPDLGRARVVRVEKASTVIAWGHDKNADAERHIAKLRAQMEQAGSQDDKEKLRERLARINHLAIIGLGAADKAEFVQSADHIEYALRATRMAIADGVVPGGGTALLRCIPAARKAAESLHGDQKIGADVVIRALERPARIISENSGADGATVVAEILSRGEQTPNIGYDTESADFVDMFQANIISPTRVVRAALACSARYVGALLASIPFMLVEDDGHSDSG